MGCVIEHDFNKPQELVELDDIKRAIATLNRALNKISPFMHKEEWDFLEDQIRKLFCSTKILTDADILKDPLIVYEVNNKKWFEVKN